MSHESETTPATASNKKTFFSNNSETPLSIHGQNSGDNNSIVSSVSTDSCEFEIDSKIDPQKELNKMKSYLLNYSETPLSAAVKDGDVQEVEKILKSMGGDNSLQKDLCLLFVYYLKDLSSASQKGDEISDSIKLFVTRLWGDLTKEGADLVASIKEIESGLKKGKSASFLAYSIADSTHKIATQEESGVCFFKKVFWTLGRGFCEAVKESLVARQGGYSPTEINSHLIPYQQ